MFSIDLLKGKGLPEKVDLTKLTLKALPILIPVLAVTLFASAYQHDRASLRNQQQVLKSNQQELELYTDDIAEHNMMNSKIIGMKKCLNDISKAMSYRVQVSEVFVELVQALPENIFVYEMKLDRNSVQEKIQDPDSGQTKQRLVVRRKLELVLSGYDGDQGDAAVQEYLTALKQSPLLTDVFTEIKSSARQQGEVDGRPAIYYEIECVLREQGS
jgi:Tfp pilus assembly protein PilN